MTPKEKSKELVNLFGKEYAIFVVEEILQAVDWHDFEVPNELIEYYNNVKIEIEKL
jgi:hypothetical protein